MVWSPSFRKKFLQGTAVGVAGALLSIVLFSLGWLDTWEAKTWDRRASFLSTPGKATGDIRLILLDQNSLDWAKKENALSWPWPREMYGAIINYCSRKGAKALAFDVLFTEPSKYGVEDDVSFSVSASEFGLVAAAAFLGKTSGSETRWPVYLSDKRFKVIGLDKWLETTGAEGTIFPRATFPIPELAQSSAVVCNVHLKPDPDGIYRRLKVLGIFDGKALPSLGLGAYLAANPGARVSIEPGKLTVNEKNIPIDKQGYAILRYRGPTGTHKNYSAASVLKSEIQFRTGIEPSNQDRNDFKDKYVLFGFSAPGLYDLRSVPVSGVYPGVEIHASMLDNLLSNDFMRKPSIWITITLVFVLALACAILTSFFNRPLGSVPIGLVFISMPVMISLSAYVKGFWLPFAVQETSVISTIVLALVVNYATEGRQKRFIKNAFRQYLSPAVIDQLIQQPERLKLGGDRRVISIFFSDLQGFTSISEGLSPEKLTTLLNDYLTAMTDIIHEEGGTVDKYEGDAIIAFWNAPLETADHANRLVRASLRCQAKLAEMRSAFRESIGKDMFMRIGANTGPAVVGNMGSRTRFDYTMLGDAVNLAARLEGVNKVFGTYTMISKFTRDMISDEFSVRELGRVAVVGRKEPVTVFEPLFPDEFESRKEIIKYFHRALDLFYQGRLAQAIEIFSDIQDLDPAAAAYNRKCRELMDSTQKNRQGVWVMTTK